MKTIAAKEAKQKFGQLLDAAQQEPVTIARKGRAVAVVLSVADYERLEGIEDAWWGERAKRAESGGSLGPEESERLLASILDDQN